MTNAAWITGMGLVTSLADGVAANFQAQLAGGCGLRPLTRFPAATYPQPAAGQLAPELEQRLREENGDQDLAFALLARAATEALGTPLPQPADRDLGLVLGTNFGLMESLEWCWRERLETHELDEATFVSQQDVVARAAQLVGAAGPCVQLSLSCASGAAAVEVALEWLRAGRVQRVLALCYDSLSEFCWCGLNNLRTITPERLRPFDQKRSGTIFSEGAAALLLSRRPADQAAALAQVLGAADNNNAFHLTAPARAGDGSRRVLQRALADAGIPPAQVDLVSAHATATAANDVTESAALRQVFGDRISHLPVAAFKSGFGHLLGSAGLAEAIMSVCALREGVVPPILNLTERDPECDLDAVQGAPRRGTFRVAVTNSAGIGGNNAAVVLGHAALPPVSLPVASAEVYLRRAAWVLPEHCGAGAGLPELDLARLLAAPPLPLDFPLKPYIPSVKGYLDPVGRYSLAAAALCLAPHPATTLREDFGVVSVTQYGAPVSSSEFYRQMRQKGLRLASPLIFPHGYSNTAGNLVAIEFSLGGPHLVLNNAPDPAEALAWAAWLLRRGKARDLLVIAAEATRPECLPDGWQCLNGALCLWLTREAAGAPLPTAWPDRLRCPTNRHGTVYALLDGMARRAPAG